MPALIPLRMLNEYVYCPRLFHLEHVQGLFKESADTVSGAFQHKRAESNRPKVKRKTKDGGGAPEAEAQPEFFGKSLSLSSEKLGITGKLDAIEEEGGHWAPLEGKHSSAPKPGARFEVESFHLSPEAWPSDQIQVCAQGLLLRENGFPSDFGWIYYRGSKTRVRLEFGDELINAVVAVIARAAKAQLEPMPPPLVDSPKCVRCSLNVFCLPDEINKLAGKIGEPRRIIPGRDDAGVMYVVTQGARVSKRGEAIVIEANGEKVDEVPLKDVSHVALFGHVQISTEAMHLLMASQRTVSFLSAAGRLIGTAGAPITKNIALRVAQYQKFEQECVKLSLSCAVAQAKIENQRTLLRRNLKGRGEVLDLMKGLSESIPGAMDLASLRGFEGKAGQAYFDTFPALITGKEKAADEQGTFAELADAAGWSPEGTGFFKMDGRNKRPPRDPVNAMLSFGYALLARDFVAALVGVGLDPYFGFYHSMEAGRPALALDMMEPFRPLVVDSMVVRLINTGAMKPSHFHVAETEVQMTKDGRGAFIAGYERRMDELITHPVFGYKISYRRVLDVECRLLGRFLEGEIAEYSPLRTR